MELRSQLAVHEAELMQLKQKWGKIVNRGHDRVVGVNGSSASHSHSSDVSRGQVLGGIKEGVERLLAVSLGEVAPATTTQQIGSNTAWTHSTRQSTSSAATSSSRSSSTRYSHDQSSMNSSVVEDDFSLESPREQELESQTLIVEKAESTLTVGQNSPVEIATVVEVSSMEKNKATKARRRRSCDVFPPTERKLATVPENNNGTARMSTTPLSSISRLGSLPPGTPSWVIGTVGKKWEELQRTETWVLIIPYAFPYGSNFRV
jgi:hypothetical protein